MSKISPIEKSHLDLRSNIMKGFSNVDDLHHPNANSENQERIQKAIEKEELDVISKADVENDFGGKYVPEDGYKKFVEGIEDMIKKGEEDNLTSEEFEELEKAISDRDALVKKVVQDGKYKTIIFVKEEQE